MPVHTIEVNGVVQRFNYKDSDDLVRQLTQAQMNATQKIAQQSTELKRLEKIGNGGNGNGNGHAPKFEAVTASREQLDNIALLISDPVTASEGIRQAVELGLGGSIEDIRKSLSAGARLAERERQIAEGEKFRREHPDFLLYDDETRLAIEADILKWLGTRNLPLTAANIGAAYIDLGKSELLPPRPAPQTSTTEPATRDGSELPPSDGNSSRRPRASFSTGVRNGVGTHDVPTPTRKSPGEIWAEIDGMSQTEYDNRMRDAEFRKMVDSLPRR